MKQNFVDFLFTKHILVSDHGENQVEVLYALLNKLNVKVTSGFELANPELIRYAARQIGEYVPEPFYRGFPQTVRELTPMALLLDQLVHYTKTYGFNDFSEAGHSVFEDAIERSEFEETEQPHEFRILTEEAALAELKVLVDAMCLNSRPMNIDDLEIVAEMAAEYSWMPKTMAGKTNAVELLCRTRNTAYARFLNLPDIAKIVDTIQYNVYGSKHTNKLNLKNQDRKFIGKILDAMLARNKVSYSTWQECAEKRALWKGLLHHIHYVGKTENGKAFVRSIFNDNMRSAYSIVEMLKQNAPEQAAEELKLRKGNAALLRSLNEFLLLTDEGDADRILDLVDAKSPLVLMQLQNQYRNYNRGTRMFKFVKHGTVRTHIETERKSALSAEKVAEVMDVLEEKLHDSLRGRAGKVYVAPGMEKIAVPMSASSGETGFGILPTGSRIKLPEGKKIRAFTYWEKVNDIDLSCFGINADGSRKEFSWRTMWNNQSDAVTYSGDETSGYHGGSEYFDVDFEKVHEMYPEMKYIVFCDNVYTPGVRFDQCVCRAGWMSRDILDSGEVYEPKTIKSAYTIDAKSTFCYLYAIDIEKREVIWLNMAENSNVRVAGTAKFDWLYPTFTLTDTMNMRKLFAYAGQLVDSPDEADLVVGDIQTDKDQIRSWEFEKALAYLR